MRHVLVAPTDEEAWRLARPAYDAWYRSIIKLWNDHGDHTYDVLNAAGMGFTPDRKSLIGSMCVCLSRTPAFTALT